MRVNAKTALSSQSVLLVPYEARHVPTYHAWMQDPDIQEATASEPMSLEEEYENQVSWRTAHDKMTFILCLPLESGELASVEAAAAAGERVVAGGDDAPGRMIGDVNLFLSLWDGQDEEAGGGAGGTATGKRQIVGEVDIMVAEPSARGRGIGRSAVRVFLSYIATGLDEILDEFGRGAGTEAGQELELRGFVAKIKASNAASIALFRGLGFRQDGGGPNYFGEVMMTLPAGEMRSALIDGGGPAFREMKYCEAS